MKQRPGQLRGGVLGLIKRCEQRPPQRLASSTTASPPTVATPLPANGGPTMPRPNASLHGRASLRSDTYEPEQIAIPA